jgi:hypothetical protein
LPRPACPPGIEPQVEHLHEAAEVVGLSAGQELLGKWAVDEAAVVLLEQPECGAPSTTVSPAAHQLVRQLGETVHVAALDRDRVLYVSSVVPARGVAAPTVPVAPELTPLGQVLSTEHR